MAKKAQKSKVNGKTVVHRDSGEDERLEAQDRVDDLPETLGVTRDELQVIQAFVGIINSRMASAPTEPLVSAAEALIRKRYPNNDEAIAAVEPSNIEHYAAQYVENNSIGRAVGGLLYQTPIDKAKNDLAYANRRCFKAPGDPTCEVNYAKQVKWLAQMQCQVVLKEALLPVLQAVYRLHTGSFYSLPDVVPTEDAVESDEYLTTLMG